MEIITVLLLFYGAHIIKAAEIEHAIEQSNPAIGIETELEEEQTESDELTGIIGGKQAKIQNYPYTCAIIVRTGQLGAGAIINKNWIVTSAWTLDGESPQEVFVRCGSNSAVIGGQTAWAAKLIVHPKYSHFRNDVALIKLKTSLKFDKTVQPITIGNGISDGQSASLAGFGVTIDSTSGKKKQQIHDGWLRSANFKVTSYSKCKQYYKSESTFSKNNFCTKVTARLAPCSFESGDPLVSKNKLVGLFSGATKCGDPNYPAVYTDLSQQKSWIQATIKKGSVLEEDIEA